MPEKRDEVVEEVDTSQATHDVYESWLKKQVEAKSDSMKREDRKLAEVEAGDEEEDEIDDAKELHEKARRRKRARGSAT